MRKVDVGSSPPGSEPTGEDVGARNRAGAPAGTLAGQGDPQVSMRLLWRGATPSAPRTRGPGRRPGWDVDAIVEAATAVADAAGIAGTSVRGVAERLGVTPMALYTYVPGKAELVDLMYDGVHAELPRDYDLSRGWRPALTAWAGDLLALYLRHPWASQVSFARAVLGPHEQATLDTLAAVLRRTGLPPELLRRVTTVLFHLVRGTARTVTEARDAAAGGTTEQDWWVRRTGALLAQVPDFAERFPHATWLGRGGADHDHRGDDGTPYVEREAMRAFHAGLAVVFDGMEAAISRGQPG